MCPSLVSTRAIKGLPNGSCQPVAKQLEAFPVHNLITIEVQGVYVHTYPCIGRGIRTWYLILGTFVHT